MAIRLPRIPGVASVKGILPKRPIIKGVDNATLAGGLVVATLAALYYAQKQGLLQLPGLGGAVTPTQEEQADEGGAQTGHKISFVVSPTTQVENGTILVSGNITDSNGVAYQAPNLYYYLYEEQNGSLIKQVAAGSVGNNVSTFRKVISLPGLRPGDYAVRVSEELLPSTGQILSGSTPIGGQAPPFTDNIINDIGPGITIS